MSSIQVEFILQHADLINWNVLSSANVVYEYANLINWDVLSDVDTPPKPIANPVYDYADLKSCKHDLHSNLIEYLYHPERIAKHLERGFELESYLI